jgi:hypothetical protein
MAYQDYYDTIVTTAMDHGSDKPPRAEILKMAQHINTMTQAWNVAHDAASLVTAVSRAVVEGKNSVIMLPGTYTLTAPITIPANVTVQGFGLPVIQGANHTITCGNYVRFRGVSFVNTLISGAAGLVVDGCLLSNASVLGGANECLVNGCRFTGKSANLIAAIKLNGSYSNATNNHILGGPNNAYAIELGTDGQAGISSINVSGNNIEGSGWGVVVRNNCWRIGVTGNNIVSHAQNCIFLSGDATTVAANNCASPATSIHITGGADYNYIQLCGATHSNAGTGNTIVT